MAGNVRAVEIALPQMNPRRAFVDRDPPKVVDDEGRAGLDADSERRARLLGDRRLVLVLHSQLHEFCADPDEARDPAGAIDDRIKGVERAHERMALPTTGVEGAAMSRGCIGPR